MEILKDKARGSWYLVAASEYEKWGYQLYKKDQKIKNKDTTLKKKYSKNCGYIVLQDSKIVIFYSNDLDGTLSKDIYDVTDEEAIKLVRGLGPMYRCVGNESLNKTCFQVPVLIVACNIFMGSVDILYHRISINKIKRKETRVSMTLFNFFLSLAIHNSYSIYQWLVYSKKNTSIKKGLFYGQFKR